MADAVIHILWSVDHREWQCAISSFGPSVEVDCTSLSGGYPLIQRSDDLVSKWKKFLPGFDRTQHLAEPVLVKVEGNIVSACCAITATHTLEKERWIVRGHYKFGLELKGQTWKIVRTKLETAYIDGNTDLPGIATERLEANQ